MELLAQSLDPPFAVSESGASLVVPISSVAPFHNSVGDLAAAQTTQVYLACSGVPSYLTSIWERPSRPIVVGGGDLIGAPAGGRWAPIKPHFLPRGPHLLNAVGVDLENAGRLDLSNIRDYRYVSVRDHESQELFAATRADVRAVPCPATLQPGVGLELARWLPGYEALRSLDVGGYYVVHRHPSLEPVALEMGRRGSQYVVVDMQAHAQHPWQGGGTVLAGWQPPEIVKGLVSDSLGVVTASLHLAIFAIGSKKPFAVPDGDGRQAQKVLRYLRRASLEDASVPIREAVDRIDDFGEALIDRQLAESVACLDHLQSLRETILGGP